MKIVAVISSLILLIGGCSDDASNVIFPTDVYIQKLSPNKKTNAIVYSWKDKDGMDLVGSYDRFTLGFSNTNSKWYIDFDLSEGFGTYEGGIIDLKWLNDNEVLIERRISDSKKDIKYNISKNEWTHIDSD